MNCQNCGNKLLGSEKYCPSCGARTSIDITSKPVDSNRTTSIVLGIISIVGVCLFIVAPISLILSFIGLILAIKANKNVNNTAGIILNAISLLLSVIFTIAIAIVIIIVINVSKYGYDNIDKVIDNNIIEDYLHGDYGADEFNYGDNF